MIEYLQDHPLVDDLVAAYLDYKPEGGRRHQDVAPSDPEDVKSFALMNGGQARSIDCLPEWMQVNLETAMKEAKTNG